MNDPPSAPLSPQNRLKKRVYLYKSRKILNPQITVEW